MSRLGSSHVLGCLALVTLEAMCICAEAEIKYLEGATEGHVQESDGREAGSQPPICGSLLLHLH